MTTAFVAAAAKKLSAISYQLSAFGLLAVGRIGDKFVNDTASDILALVAAAVAQGVAPPQG
jgi:hypothetical protein